MTTNQPRQTTGLLRDRNRLRVPAVIALGTILVAGILSGCLHEEGGGVAMMTILADDEIPSGLENCSTADAFQEDGEADPAGEEEDDLPEPTEMGWQSLAKQGPGPCEDAEYLILLLSYGFASNEDYQETVDEYKGIWDNSEENEAMGFDMCSFVVLLWGDKRILMAFPDDPNQEEDDPFNSPAGEDLPRVADALMNKYPNMESNC